MSISLSSPTVSGSRVHVHITSGKRSRHLSSGDFWADYGDLDISEVDPSILILPALGSVLPVAIALGVEVRAPFVDSGFAEAVDELVPVWRAMYPAFASSGFAFNAPRVEQGRAHQRDGAVLLYSGGLDSAASLIANGDRARALLSVWGADVSVDDQELWRSLDDLVGKTALTDGRTKIVVRSNLRELLDQPRLIHDFLGGAPADWWGGVQHGMGLLTLAAPVTEALGLDAALMAGSHSVDFNVPWGSSPRTDPLMRWAGVHVEHDSYELTRQGKIDTLVAPYLASGGDLLLAVCYQPGRGTIDINCGECEKCIRTASGLLSAGIDPGDVGVSSSIATLNTWQQRLEDGTRHLDENELFMWQDVQRSARNNTLVPSELAPYMRWLSTFDFSSRSTPPPAKSERLRAAGRYWARRMVHRLPKRAKDSLRRIRG